MEGLSPDEAMADLASVPARALATAGSLFHLPLVVDVPVAEAVGAMREAGLRILAEIGRASCRERV